MEESGECHILITLCPQRRLSYPLRMRLQWPQSRSEHIGEDKYFRRRKANQEITVVQLQSCHCTD